MRVLYILNIPSPYRVKFLDILADKCELTVIYDRHSASDRDNRWYVESSKKYKEVYLKGIPYSNDSAITFGIGKYLKKKKYDIIVVGGYATFSQMMAIIILKMKRIQYYLNVDGVIGRPESKVKHLIKRFFIKGAHRYLSTGVRSDEYLIEHGADKDSIRRYSFTSISKKDILDSKTDKAESVRIKRDLGCDTENMILAVGSPIYRKGFDVLLRAFGRIKTKADLYIVGGNVTDEYQEIIQSLDIKNVHFVPFMKKDELDKYYIAADLFVMPTRYDIWGLVVNEALAKGLPVVTTDMCNAGLELVEDGVNGYIVPAENEEELSRAIDTIFTDGDRIRMSQNSLIKIERYTLENMADEHVKLFDEMWRE